MPKVESVAALVRAIGEKNHARMRTIVEQMIAHERSANKTTSAEKLEYALRSWPNVLQMVELPSNIKSLVWPEDSTTTLLDVYLDDEVANGVNMFIRERINHSLIHDAGLPVRKSLLLAGPPGNGKTSLASALANELGLQLISVKMHSLIDSHMGESSRNIGKVFEYAMMNDCLLFIDEFDAVGSQRVKGADNSGREYNNIVTTLLTNIDRFPDSGVLIAATNMPDGIDQAIQRRFDVKLWLGNPSATHIKKYISKYQNEHNICLRDSLPELVSKLEGSPWSAVESACIDIHKELILGQPPSTANWVGMQSGLAI